VDPSQCRFARRVLMLSGLAVALSAARGVGADEEPFSIGSLDPVSRTAMGSAVSVITRKEIEERQFPFVADLLREIPGVAVNRSGPVGGVTQVRIRGAEGNHTLVFIDGIEANDPANNSEFNFANLMSYDVERIEVLRGPQSALYGSEAIGGVINIITREGKPGLGGELEGEGGSFGTARAAGSFSAGGENYRLFADGSYFRDRGINAAPRGGEDDGYENVTINAKGSWDPLESLRVDGVFRWVDSESQDDQSNFGVPPAVFDAHNETDPRELYARLQSELRVGENWTHRIGAAITDTRLVSRNELFGFGRNQGRNIQLDYQTSYAFSVAENFDNRVTLKYQHQDLRFRNQFDGSLTKNDNQDSGIAEYRLGWNDRLFLSGSVRYDANEHFDDDWTFRTTASFVAPWKSTVFRGSFGKGVQNPGFFELYAFFPGFLPNPDLESETSKGFDLGIDQRLWGDRLNFSVNYYQSDLRNEIRPVFLPSLESTVVNDRDRSKRRGFEFEAVAALGESWTLNASYTYAIAKEGADQHYERELRRPRHLASVFSNYRFFDRRGQINVGIVYNGRQYDDDFTQGFTPVRTALDHYLLTSLALSFRITERVEIFGRVENLFNDSYHEVYGFESPGIGGFGGVRIRFAPHRDPRPPNPGP
jgi:vitamin B12 transporter